MTRHDKLPPVPLRLAFFERQERPSEERQAGDHVDDLSRMRVGGCEAVLEASDGQAGVLDEQWYEGVGKVAFAFCEGRKGSANGTRREQRERVCGLTRSPSAA